MSPFYTPPPPPKIPESLWFPGVFRRCRMRALNRNGLMQKEKQDPFTEYIFQFAEKILRKQM